MAKSDASKKGNDLLKITLVKSTIGVPEKLKRVVKALGLRKTNSSVVKKIDPAIQGMIFKVSHLVKVEKAAE